MSNDYNFEEIKSKFFEYKPEIKPKSSYPILPEKGRKNILITSALPYVNNIPHLGNIIGCVLSADCYARFSRMRGNQTLYICGTDSYGTATETKAIEEGLSCEEICSKYHEIHAHVYKWFNISFDYFGKTNTEIHTKISQNIFSKVFNRKYLSENIIDQLYCEKCQKFLADRFIEGICNFCNFTDARGDQCDACGRLINPIELKSPRCKHCRSEPVIKSSKHLFLELSKIQPLLEDYLGRTWHSGWSSNAISITKAWLKEGLKARCITRDLKWGTPVPLDEFKDKVLYVWFDAPIGYISITANYTDKWEEWWKNAEVKLVNFMAKDNVPFHTVIFPSTLIAADDKYICLSEISSTEYLNYEDGKFSKSRGIGVFGNDVMNTSIKSDIYRMYLLASRPENHDSSFSWDDLLAKNNNEFINNIGNFINRSLSLLFRSFGGKIQKIELTEIEINLIANINISLNNYIESMNSYKFRDAYSHISHISHLSNEYFQHSKPWEIKNDKVKLGSILSFSTNIVALLSLMMEPFAPEVCQQIQNDIKLKTETLTIPLSFYKILDDDTIINKPPIYFKKIDPTYIEKLKLQFSGNQN